MEIVEIVWEGIGEKCYNSPPFEGKYKNYKLTKGMSCIMIHGLNSPYQNNMLKCIINVESGIYEQVQVIPDTNSVTRVNDKLFLLALLLRFLVYRPGQSSIFIFPVIIFSETITTWVPYSR